MKKKLLLICYSFPPNAGIGGRRWAKFAKYLTKKGYEIHVICAKHSGKELSEWIADVKNEKIKVYEIDAFYPRAFKDFSNSIFNKISFRFWTFFFKLLSNGVIYERTFFWKKPLYRKAVKIINEHKIKNIIVTIPPFRLAHHALNLKLFDKNLNLIVDYRDPWTQNKTFHGFKNLSLRRLNYEEKIEREVLQKSDYVITTNEEMTNWAKERVNSHKEKCLTIVNGYDRDDIISVASDKKKEGKKIFISAGSLYNDLEHLFIPFVRFIQSKEQQDKNFADKYGFEFYGKAQLLYLSLVKESNVKSISFNGFISRQELNKKYNDADFFLMFTVSDHAFAFNTKFCEYIAYHKPIIHFSYDGDVTRFLETHQLGWGVRPDSFNEDMNRLFDLIEGGKFNYNNSFDTTGFSVEKLTEKIEQLLTE